MEKQIHEHAMKIANELSNGYTESQQNQIIKKLVGTLLQRREARISDVQSSLSELTQETDNLKKMGTWNS